MFKLLKLKINNHPYLTDLDLSFVKEDEEKNGPYTTLLIGPNGTGKSQILSIIIEIFNFATASFENGRTIHHFSFDFEIVYLFDSQKTIIKCRQNKIQTEIDGKIESLQKIQIPKKILASAINLIDRYPVLRKQSKLYNKSYEYLGIRSASNNAFVNNHSRSIVRELGDSVAKKENIKKLKVLFEQLELVPTLSIVYKPGSRYQTSFFSNDIFMDSIEDKVTQYFQQYIKTQKEKGIKSYRIEKYEKIIAQKDLLKFAYEFLSRHENSFTNQPKSQVQFTSNLNFDSNKSIQDFIKNVEGLKILVDLEILSLRDINLQKTSTSFEFTQASSGEYHLLASFLGMYSKIEDNSLIIIDEPEISLHPNWQMKYMNTLNQIFEDYPTCHFVIASHSHFLVSDLLEKKSSILKLYFNSETKNIGSTRLDWNTYAWSAEQVLIEVFKVASSRNFYLTELINETLSLMAKKSLNVDDEKILKDKKELLKSFKLDLKDVDPLKIIISKILE